jgi:hypothetical protein
VDREIFAVSQFTLAGSMTKGRRPSFDQAINPKAARVLFRQFLALLKHEYPHVNSGFFQEHMKVELVNDGSVTFIQERWKPQHPGTLGNLGNSSCQGSSAQSSAQITPGAGGTAVPPAFISPRRFFPTLLQ